MLASKRHAEHAPEYHYDRHWPEVTVLLLRDYVRNSTFDLAMRFLPIAERRRYRQLIALQFTGNQYMQLDSSELFLHAVQQGDTVRVVSLLDQGADPNTYVERTEQLRIGESLDSSRVEPVTLRKTALDLAIFQHIANVLLDRGARATAAALGNAVQRDAQELVRRLLEGRADPNELFWTSDSVEAEIFDQYTAADYVELHRRVSAVSLASQVENHALFLLLVAAGGKPSKEEYTKMLMRARSTKDLEAVRSLVEAAERQGIILEQWPSPST